MSAQRATVELFTAGSCDPNPGPGGWGLVLRAGRTERELYGSVRETTSNRAELLAIIAGIEQLTQPSRVQVFSASSYLCNSINSWRGAWKRRGWKKRNGEEVENRDLWERLDAVINGHRLQATRLQDRTRYAESGGACELAAQGAREAAEQRMVEDLGPGPAAAHRPLD